MHGTRFMPSTQPQPQQPANDVPMPSTQPQPQRPAIDVRQPSTFERPRTRSQGSTKPILKRPHTRSQGPTDSVLQRVRFAIDYLESQAPAPVTLDDPPPPPPPEAPTFDSAPPSLPTAQAYVCSNWIQNEGEPALKVKTVQASTPLSVTPGPLHPIFKEQATDEPPPSTTATHLPATDEPPPSTTATPPATDVPMPSTTATQPQQPANDVPMSR